MALQFQTRSVNIAQKVADVVSQTLVEGDVIVPDIKPDIREIMQVDAKVMVDTREISGGTARITGRMEFCVLYTAQGADGCLATSIMPTLPFEFRYDVGNVLEDDVVKIRTDIPHVEYHVINSRKISVKAVITVNTLAFRMCENEMLCGIDAENGEEVECLYDTKCVYHTQNLSSQQLMVREEFELPAGKPPIGEILKYDVRALPQEAKCITDKIVAKGDLNVNLLYTAALDRSLQWMEYNLSYTEILPAPGVEEASDVLLEYELIDTEVKAKPDYDGDQVYLEVAAELGVLASAGQPEEISVLSDCFAPGYQTEMETETLQVQTSVQYSQINHSLRDTVELTEAAPDIKQVCEVQAQPHIQAVSIADGMAKVDGMVSASLLYVSDNENNPVYSMQKEIPFETEFAAVQDGSANVDVTALLTHVSYNLIGDREAEIRCNIALNVKDSCEETMEAISKIQLSEEAQIDTAVPGIIIYFAQKDDSLWKVAKKYNVTQASIISANELEENQSLSVGQQLLIPRHVS